VRYKATFTTIIFVQVKCFIFVVRVNGTVMKDASRDIQTDDVSDYGKQNIRALFQERFMNRIESKSQLVPGD